MLRPIFYNVWGNIIRTLLKWPSTYFILRKGIKNSFNFRLYIKNI